MYIVRFVRTDGNPDEEYCYYHWEDALFHFSLFKNDNSGLYKHIDLLEMCNRGSDETCILFRHDVK